MDKWLPEYKPPTTLGRNALKPLAAEGSRIWVEHAYHRVAYGPGFVKELDRHLPDNRG